MNDISPHHLEIVKAILRKHIPDREVWYFGSRATGTAKLYSDLELAVIGTTPLTLTQLASLEYHFDQSDLPYKVDEVDWAEPATPSVRLRQRRYYLSSKFITNSKTAVKRGDTILT